MKFITEDDLRDLYKKEPFTSYEQEPGTRLTPGARQFLMDKGINMFDTDNGSREKNTEIKQTETAAPEKKCENKKLYNRMNSAEALFFLTEEELLGRDVCLAQSVINLRKQFAGMKNAIKNKAPFEKLYCKECTGINNNNFSEAPEDCFEISEFHVQLEKGREIVILHRLRCALKELGDIVPELYECGDNDSIQSGDIIAGLNQIINSLSQLICSAFGGKKCQRQN